MNVDKLLEDLLNNMNLIKPEDIPNIDLYMDHVTTFMDRRLYSTKRIDDEKALTKTMINNYAKNDLLPSPEKKKYSKDHVLLLTLIYYFKNVMSISDIKKLMQPITDKFFHTSKGADLVDVYSEIEGLMDAIGQKVSDDVHEKAKVASNSYNSEEFKSVSEKDANYLKLFSLVSMLCFDIYLKKQLVEAIVDTLEEPISKADREKLAKREQEEREKLAKKEREEREKQLKRQREEREKFKK